MRKKIIRTKDETLPLKFDGGFYQLSLERTGSIVAQDLVFRVFLRANPRGPAAESSAVLE